jgi:hypothetical protein
MVLIIILVIKNPPNSRRIPRILLASKLKRASLISFSRIRFMVYSEKLEKVVKPPKNPTSMKSLI